MAAPAPPVPVCAACGSDRVRRDAWAVWSSATRSWILDAMTPVAFCEDCNGETGLASRPLAGAGAAGA